VADFDVGRDHERHDRLAIAEAVDRPGPSRLARALVAACADCAGLYADLQALALALSATATPARPRDFTLTEADAERLRSRSLRHWLGRIGTARDTITRPLALGLTTLGLAGLLVATVPGLPLGMGSSPAPSAAPAAEAPAAEPFTVESAASAPSAGEEPVGQGATSGVDATGDRPIGGRMTTPEAAPLRASTGTSPTPLTILSIAFLGIGAALFAIRRFASMVRVR
jgi:hypothetical protein